jgi:hypothetical protein
MACNKSSSLEPMKMEAAAEPRAGCNLIRENAVGSNNDYHLKFLTISSVPFPISTTS